LKFGFNGLVRKEESVETLVEAINKVHNLGYYADEKSNSVLFELAGQANYLKSNNIKITNREKEFLVLCSDRGEYTYKEIAYKMGVSVRTIDGYRDSLFNKIGVRRRSGLVSYFLTAIKRNRNLNNYFL
jgi:DNA-binding NarL/FixJ family response regulator